jgi:hemerythrin superfamily protein
VPSNANKSTAKKSALKKSVASKSKTARPAKIYDAVALLKEDHKTVKKLFKEFDKMKEKAGDNEKEALVKRICSELTVHAQIEEAVFYPAVRKAIDDQDLLDEATVEHASAKDLIKQLQGMSPSDDLYDAKVTVLGEYIDHHVQEEQDEMFKKAKKAKMDMEKLGRKMLTLKRALVKEMQPTE